MLQQIVFSSNKSYPRFKRHHRTGVPVEYCTVNTKLAEIATTGFNNSQRWLPPGGLDIITGSER